MKSRFRDERNSSDAVFENNGMHSNANSFPDSRSFAEQSIDPATQTSGQSAPNLQTQSNKTSQAGHSFGQVQVTADNSSPQIQAWGMGDLVDGISGVWNYAQNAWNQVQDWIGGPGVYIVHDSDARIRTAPPELKFMGERIPKGSHVKVLETVANEDKTYASVQVVEGTNEGQVLGWTLASNLSRAQKTDDDNNKTDDVKTDDKKKQITKPEDLENTTTFEGGKNDVTAEVLESVKEELKEAGETPESWFDNFVNMTFLGKSMKYPIHRIFAAHLKDVEANFMSQTGAQNPKEAGKKLGLTGSSVSGGRVPGEDEPSTSMHVFGLAIDLDVMQNPWIAMPNSAKDKTEAGGEEKWSNTYYGYMQELLGGEHLEFKRDFNIGSVKGVSLDDRLTATIDNILKIDKMVESYFSLLEPENDVQLQTLLNKTTSSRWKGLSTEQAREQIQKDLINCGKIWRRSSEKQLETIRTGGITNLSEDVIRGMDMYWGGMFGDLMHFDLRDRGIGNAVYRAALKYKNAHKK